MKTYTEEQVKTILANAMQNVTNNLYKKRKIEEESAKNYAMNYVSKANEKDRTDSLRHLSRDSILVNVIDDIKSTQYHLYAEKLLESVEMK